MQTTGFSYSGSELDAMAEARNYYKWILRLARPYIGGKVTEVGAGVGNFAAALLAEIPVSELWLVEPAENLHPRLVERFDADARVHVVKGYFGSHFTPREMDSIIAVNVIEHIQDDAEFLRSALNALTPGGTVVLFAPALEILYGTLDEAFEHYRRYTKSNLVHKLVTTGFRLEKVLYLNFAGIFTWLLAGRVLRKRTLHPAQVRFYDRWMVPWVSRAEKLWEPPLGQSLLAIARKPLPA